MAGTIQVPFGSQLPLVLQVHDGSGSVFPRARVFDSTFTEVSGSPFNLTHVGNGLYKNTAFTPDRGVYYATYTVYSDSGYATVLSRYSRASDQFEVSDIIEEVDNDNDSRAV